ncbi:MAG TPA: hypothetical protein PKA31_01345 [Candidatus Moranbacteria bacterium]|nr:hypothetical protein [Candidatus Moranbacteria bacterium]
MEYSDSAKEQLSDSPHSDLPELKRHRDRRVELTLFFILGLLLGFTFKTEAVKRITIGFDDYQISAGRQAYDIEGLERKLSGSAATEQSTGEGDAGEDVGGAEDSAKSGQGQ